MGSIDSSVLERGEEEWVDDDQARECLVGRCNQFNKWETMRLNMDGRGFSGGIMSVFALMEGWIGGSELEGCCRRSSETMESFGRQPVEDARCLLCDLGGTRTVGGDIIGDMDDEEVVVRPWPFVYFKIYSKSASISAL